ncbi:MAG: hypothetical protein ACREU2_09955 [Steroidobacteraceae bacterium]
MPATSAGLSIIIAGGMLTGKGPAGGLKPKPPTAPKVTPMPSQSLVDQGQQLEEAQAASARYGRASTILSTNATTGDKLGP